jgi:hypothetical protein
MTYLEWIEQNVPDPRGTCREVTEEMAKEFPELRRVRGCYYCWTWGEREHWWLVDEVNDRIIDPTAAQFPSKGTGTYEEWDESHPEPTGMCPNCGEYCYKGEQVHEHCHDEFVRSLS